MPPPAVSTSDCYLGIIFALPIEAHSFERSVSDVVSYRANGLSISRGLFAGRSVAWAVSGCGEVAAARAAQLIIDGHRPPSLALGGHDSLAHGHSRVNASLTIAKRGDIVFLSRHVSLRQ